MQTNTLPKVSSKWLIPFTDGDSLALAFNRASLLLPLDLFQTFAGTSIMGGTTDYQWVGNFLFAV
jgi:hypothetical protein